MTGRLYALALRAYPTGYRATHGGEILATVSDAAGPDRRWPSAREAAGLVRGGCATRVRRAADGPPGWADGLHLGIALVALGNSMTDLAGPYPYWRAGSLVLLLAVLRGWVWLALPLALASSFEVARVPLYGTVGQSTAATGLGAFGPAYGELASAFPYWTVAAGLLVLCVRRGPAPRTRRPLRTRSWWWLAVLAIGMTLASPPSVWPTLSVPGTAFGLGSPETLLRLAAGVGLLLGAAGAASVTGDTRWLLATVVYRLPADLATALRADRVGVVPLAGRVSLAIATVGALAVAHRAGRDDRALG